MAELKKIQIGIEYFENIVIKIEIEKSKKDAFFKDIDEKKIRNIEIISIEQKIVNIY